MTDLSTLLGQEQIKKVDEKTAIRYRVVEEMIDLEALRREKKNLEAQLEVKEPSDEELIEHGKMIHSFYTIDAQSVRQRIDEINKILGT